MYNMVYAWHYILQSEVSHMPAESNQSFPFPSKWCYEVKWNETVKSRQSTAYSRGEYSTALQSYCIKELFMALLITGACLPHRCSVHNCNWTGLKTIAVLTLDPTLLVILVRSMTEQSHLVYTQEDSTSVLDIEVQQIALWATTLQGQKCCGEQM